MRQVVADAKQNGIDLKVVVMSQSPPIDTPLRDIATEVGKANPGSTVLVISPGWAGTYSTSYDRVTLEAGQDVAKTGGNPVQATKNFVSQLQTPRFPVDSADDRSRDRRRARDGSHPGPSGAQQACRRARRHRA